MSENSKIEWTDHTFNPWIGCTKVSPGCANCYAETLMDTRYGRVEWGKGKPRQRTSEANWRLPRKWNAKWDRDIELAEPMGIELRRPRVFCASLADWLDDEVPIEWLADLLALIHATPNLDWLLLSKRPGNWRTRLEAAMLFNAGRCGGICTKEKAPFSNAYSTDWKWLREDTPPSNVWIGTTVEDQTRADERIPALLQIPAKVRFLSCEPLLSPVNLTEFLPWKGEHQSKGFPEVLGRQLRMCSDVPGIDWVIAGGESGPGARPMHPDWPRSLRDQCQQSGVPFLFKQWGEWWPINQMTEPDHRALYVSRKKAGAYEDQAILDDVWGRRCTVEERAVHLDGSAHEIVAANAWPLGAMLTFRAGKKAAGRLLDGREWNDLPTP